MEDATVDRLMRKIRSYINSPRRKALMLYDSGKFNQLIACLDLIEDTELAIQDYKSIKKFNFGEGYLQIYGLMQAFVMQQDAVRFLSVSLFNRDINLLERFPEIKLIRDIRIVTVGHPVKNRHQLYTQIVRAGIRVDSVTILTRYDDGESDSKIIHLVKLISDQEKCISQTLQDFINDLDEDEKQFKMKYRNHLLKDLFIKQKSYIFEKLYVFNEENLPQAKISIDIISDFKKKVHKNIIERYKYIDRDSVYNHLFTRLDYSIELYRNLLLSGEYDIRYEAYADLIKKIIYEIEGVCRGIDEYFEDE